MVIKYKRDQTQQDNFYNRSNGYFEPLHAIHWPGTFVLSYTHPLNEEHRKKLNWREVKEDFLWSSHKKMNP